MGGGQFAHRYMMAYPERIERLVVGISVMQAAAAARNDLVALVLDHIDRPVDLVAQSMGGVIAVRAALERPELIHHLVLVATSGGVDLWRFRGQDWREDYRREYPAALPAFIEDRTDLSDRLPSIQIPTLLIWGDRDPISPLPVGHHLAGVLPRADLVVIPGGEHMLGGDRAADVAPHIPGT